MRSSFRFGGIGAQAGRRSKSDNFMDGINAADACYRYSPGQITETPMLDHYRMFAAYNAWANRTLYEAVASR
ncbi:MAG: hypothetical protein J7516_07710 [Shinella sp.]|nr:hypothetical protein [Shinella sp.]